MGHKKAYYYIYHNDTFTGAGFKLTLFNKNKDKIGYRFDRQSDIDWFKKAGPQTYDICMYTYKPNLISCGKVTKLTALIYGIK